MTKSKEIRRYTDAQGRELVEYENGGIKDAKGHFVEPPTANKITTSEQAAMMGKNSQLKRKEKQREKIREEILRVTNDANIPDLGKLTDSQDAFAVGAGLVWERAVLSPDAYPRDSIDGIQALAELGDFVPNKREALVIEQMNIQNNNYIPGAAAEVLELIREVLHDRGVTDAEILEAEEVKAAQYSSPIGDITTK